MDAYTIRDAAERLDDLIGRAEAGESVDIEREGRVVARLVPVAEPVAETTPFDWPAYWESIKGMPVYPGNSVVEMRKEARY
jgi:antitoxin (DNA-binding transcriptional repressor) of toxin-antitoxin stability system